MSTDAEDALIDLYEGRSEAGVAGFRVERVFLLMSYSDANTDGAEILTDNAVEITEANGQPPKVKTEKDDQVPGGHQPSGVKLIGPITPKFPGGGTDLTPLIRTLDAGEQRYLLLKGPKNPDGARYRIIDVNADKALRYIIRAQDESNPQGGYYPTL